MSKSEHRIQDEVRKLVSEHCKGVIFRTNAGSAYAGDKIFSPEYGQHILKNLRPYKGLPKGFPDLLYIGPGQTTIFIEVKTDTGKLSKEQERFHAMLNRNGFPVCVARSAREAVDFVNNREALS